MIVKIGEETMIKPWKTDAQAIRWGNKNMPKHLKAAGFDTVLYHATEEINGWDGIRIGYGKVVLTK